MYCFTNQVSFMGRKMSDLRHQVQQALTNVYTHITSALMEEAHFPTAFSHVVLNPQVRVFCFVVSNNLLTEPHPQPLPALLNEPPPPTPRDNTITDPSTTNSASS